MAAIGIHTVHKRYDRTEVLHGVDLSVPDGAFAVIVGPSGCGKSTLLRMIAGLEDITAGEIRIDGVRVNELTPRQRGCAMVFQNYALYPHMTVEQNIGFPLKVAGVKAGDRQRRVQEVAEMLGLMQLLERRPAQLSGGQRQRVAMGRAVVRKPKVFLFDEPLSNLDAKLRIQMRIEIRRLHRQIATTSVFVTHDQIEAMTMADLLVVMNAGRIEQVGSPAEIYKRPATTFVASFMGVPPMNLIDGRMLDGGMVGVDPDGRVAIATQGGLGKAGERIVVGIRPEDLVIGPETPGSLEVAVEMVEELGAGRIAYASFGANEIAIALPNASTRIDGRVHLHLPADRLHFFDPTSGGRIEPIQKMLAA